VAVLPLVTASGDSSDRYLAFGVTDEILSALAGARGVRVTSRAAAEEAQRTGLSLSQLGERFGVTHALEGTIQRVGSDLRVAVRLLGTEDGLTVWSEVFDVSTTDLLDVQRFIAQSIAAAVQQDLGTPTDTAAGAPTVTNCCQAEADRRGRVAGTRRARSSSTLSISASGEKGFSMNSAFASSSD
jgi:TolB-like protein